MTEPEDQGDGVPGDGLGPFERRVVVDKPGIVGAQWWQESLKNREAQMARRTALIGISITIGACAGLGAIFALVAKACSDDTKIALQKSIVMQQEYGWSFGAAAEALSFNGESKSPFDRDALARMTDDLKPMRSEFSPYYVPTLFQSPAAMPHSTPQGDSTAVTPLSQALLPVSTPMMETTYAQGKGLASLFQGVDASAVALVVDLPGPLSVAFAAGLAAVFDVVFQFDNWPHPRGVVPAHLTLAAAAYYQPLFVRQSRTKSYGPPAFVLDRSRLASYTDDSTQFDNRHVAKLPTVAALNRLGIRHVLYVQPEASGIELDDLNNDFVFWVASHLDVRTIGAGTFLPDSTGDPTTYYGGSTANHPWFWADYPWVKPTKKGSGVGLLSDPGKDYKPVPRATPYSTGKQGASTRLVPTDFAMVPVVMMIETGAILGAKLSRSGSWNRSSGGWGG